MATYTPIQSIVLTSAVNAYTFSNIPQNYTDLVLVIGNSNHSYPGTGGVFAGIVAFNGDFGNNYGTTFLEGTGSTTLAERKTSNNPIATNMSRIGDLPATHTINIMNYSSSTIYKSAIIRSNPPGGTITLAVATWLNTAAINSLSCTFGAYTLSAGTTFDLYGIKASTPKAIGGNITTTDGTYWYHAFKSSGTFVPFQALTCDILAVGGGGGAGGGGGYYGGGGGGAGGLLAASSQALLNGTSYSVTIGAGGAATNYQAGVASNTTFGSILTAKLGGRGYPYQNSDDGNAGSGGGGSAGQTGGSGTSGQGYAGGTAGSNAAAGGGGAGAVGGNSSAGQGGTGGVGLSTVTNWGTLSAALTATGLGSSGYLAGGGGGGSSPYYGSASPASGGTGGGGTGGSTGPTGMTFGVANTGGGGGGTGGNASGSGPSYTSGNGGSGLVIVRYSV